MISEIIKFYFGLVVHIINILKAWVIDNTTGLNYFTFLLAVMFVSFILNIFYHKIRRQVYSNNSDYLSYSLARSRSEDLASRYRTDKLKDNLRK